MKTDETDTKEDTIDIAELARAHGMAAIDTLAEIMTCAATPASVRVSAAKIILDRGFGKPRTEPPPDDGNREPISRIERVIVNPDGTEEDYGSLYERVEDVQESRARHSAERPSARAMTRLPLACASTLKGGEAAQRGARQRSEPREPRVAGP